jgi:hypothetical protein
VGEAFFDPSDSYFLFAEERGYHKWALAHSSSCLIYRQMTQTLQEHSILNIMPLLFSAKISATNICWEKCDEIWAYMFNVYKKQQSRQTGSRNMMGPKTISTIWGTNMKLVTKYQIRVINSCWEKCDEKCEYMFHVYKNQLSRQTGSRNLTDPKTLPTIWHIYMKLVTKYQISAIDSCWEKCDEKYSGHTNSYYVHRGCTFT